LRFAIELRQFVQQALVKLVYPGLRVIGMRVADEDVVREAGYVRHGSRSIEDTSKASAPLDPKDNPVRLHDKLPKLILEEIVFASQRTTLRHAL
jgi:hypothetical protein